MNVTLIIRFASFFVWQHSVDSYIIPKRARVLPPNPMRQSVLGLFPFPSSITQQFIRDSSFASIGRKSLLMCDRNFVRAFLAKQKQVVSAGSIAQGRILNN